MKKAFCIVLIFTFYTALHAQVTILPEEDPYSLFDYTIDDDRIEFSAEGTWEINTKTDLMSQFKKDSEPDFTFNPFILEQEVSLSLWFMINKAFYIEADFEDGFADNTFATGYYGEKTLKHIRAGNSKINFPDYYHIDNIGTSTRQSPGLSANFEGKDWNADVIIRYDSVSQKEKSFTGTSEISSSKLSIKSYTEGQFFAFPSSDAVKKIKAVYIEDKKGEYKNHEKTFRKLEASEYLIKNHDCLLILDKSYEGNIFIELDSSYKTSFLTELGSFGSSETPGTGFLGDIQSYFSSVEIKNYCYQENATDFFESLSKNGISFEAVKIKSSAGFSPFAVLCNYSTNQDEIDDVKLIHTKSLEEDSSFKVNILSDSNYFLQKDFVNQNKQFVQVSSNDETLFNRASARYPFAKDFPQCYLSKQISNDTDLCIQANSYKPINRFEISQNAIPGTIYVYRNGITDTAFSFSKETGEIIFSRKPSSFEKIRITWLENEKDASNGSLSIAGGLRKKMNENLSLSMAVSSQWALNNMKYSSFDEQNPGNITLTGFADFKKDDFTITDKLKASFSKDNITDFYRIEGMDDSVPETIYLKEKAFSLLNSNLIPFIDTDSSITDPLLTKAHRQESNVYTARKEGISGFAIVSDFDFSASPADITSLSPNWAAFNIDLSSVGINTAEIFNFALKNDSSETDFDVYLQLGTNSDSSFKDENRETVRTWKVTDSAAKNIKAHFDTALTGWQTVSVLLSNRDRQLLSKYKNARIIITSANSIKGKIFFGPYEVIETDFSHPKNENIHTETVKKYSESSSHIDFFDGSEKNTYLEISWNSDASFTEKISFSKFIEEASLKKYRKLNFLMNIPQGTNDFTDSSFELTLKGFTEGTSKDAFSIKLSQDTLQNMTKSVWHKVTVELDTASVFIGGEKINASNLHIDRNLSSSQLVFTMEPSSTGLQKGCILIDEIYLEDMDFSFNASNAFNFKWQDSKISEKNFITKPFVETFIETAFGKTDNENDFTVLGFLKSGFTTRGINHQFVFSRASNTKSSFFTDYSYNLETDSKKSFYLNLRENYTDNTESDNVSNGNTIKLSIPIKKQKIELSLENKASMQTLSFEQDSKSSLKYSLPIGKTRNIFFLEFSQNQNAKEKTDLENYSESFNIFKDEFSGGKENALIRKNNLTYRQDMIFDSAHFSPFIKLDFTSLYAFENQVKQNDSTAFSLEIPFKVNNLDFNISWSKKAIAENKKAKGGNYKEDIEDFTSSLKNESYLFTTLFIGDLFSSKIYEKMNFFSENELSKLYNTTYGFSLKKDLSNSVWDFFIPISAAYKLSRDIRTTSDSVSDILQNELKITFLSLNSFGSMSSSKLFSWYEQDEFTASHNIAISYKKNNPNPIEANYTLFSNSMFFINDADFIQGSINFTFSTLPKINFSGSLTYKRKPDFSPLESLIHLIFQDADLSSLKQTRYDSLTYDFYFKDFQTHTITQNHRIDMMFLDFATFSAGFDNIFSYSEEKRLFSMDNCISLKLKMEF